MQRRREKGTGSIRQRGDRWNALYWTTDGAGARRQKSATFSTKTEARKWLQERIASEVAGTVSDSERTLGEWLEEWLASRRVTSLRPSTQIWYQSAVRRHIQPCLGTLHIQKLTVAHLESFYAEKERSGRLDGSGGLGPSSVRRLHITLHRALDSAVRNRLIEHNPAELVESKPRIAKPDLSEKTWTPDQLRVFLRAVQGDRHLVLWQLAALSGLRRGELLGLRWKDVNLDLGLLHIRQTWVMVGGSPAWSTPKTERARRAVELDSVSLAALKLHRIRQAEVRLAAGEVWHDLDLVFAKEDGRPLRPDWVSDRFRKLARQAGLPSMSLHGLRHSHATALLAAGTNPKVVQERLGHYSAAFTLDAYSSVIGGLQAEAAETVAALIISHS